MNIFPIICYIIRQGRSLKIVKLDQNKKSKRVQTILTEGSPNNRLFAPNITQEW